MLRILVIVCFLGIVARQAPSREFVEVRIEGSKRGLVVGSVNPAPWIVFSTENEFKKGESLTCEITNSEALDCGSGRFITPEAFSLVGQSSSDGSARADSLRGTKNARN